MKHIKLTTYAKAIPQQADSTLQKQQEIEVWNSGIKMLGALFDLIVKILDKVKNPSP
ncbi:MAG TPA: hypothetical protein PLT82_12325 [Candidatus Hydrogenedens sp.]|nr:hypothetical protein [Candidatus Hydrogenedens sp.]HOL18724.1 hypothetical protein [Candidatus Hydrogenedens sp.]HPP59906.1 hypothetical protein [Candidatus Hydrogenedens sp.]